MRWFYQYPEYAPFGKDTPRSADRGDGDPLIIAGGPGAFNPEPLAPFIDVFLLGDGEEVLLEILDLAEKHQSSPGGRIKRKPFLEEAAGIKGVYVPAFYQVSYTAQGKVEKIRTSQPGARKKWCAELSLIWTLPIFPPVR